MTAIRADVGQFIRTVRERERERWAELERRGHDLVLQECQRWGGVPKGPLAAFFWNLRARRKSLFTSLRRFVDAAVERGTPRQELYQLPHMLVEYIDAACDERDERRRAMRGMSDVEIAL